MKIKLLFLFLFIALFPLRFTGNTCTTNAGTFGSWAALTWTCTGSPASGPPGCGDVMNIAAGTTVYISSTVDYSGCATPIQLNIYGTMDFNTGGVRFKLPPGSTVFVASGGTIEASFSGGGSSTLIAVGTEDVWTAGTGTVTGPITLPIELLSFTAKPKLNSVILEWSTATELNNDFYTLERSTNGADFQPIGTVDGSGTTNWVMNYSFEDRDPIDGVSYYRLRQTDFNGHTATFNIVAVEFHPVSDFSLNLFPNPSDGSAISLVVNADDQAQLSLSIYDLVGKIIYTTDLFAGKKGDNTFTLEFDQRLAPGMYSVSCVSGNKAHVQKLIIQ